MKIRLDIVDDTTIADIIGFAARHNCRVTVIELGGPSGHPLVEFEGEPEAIAALEAAYDEED